MSQIILSDQQADVVIHATERVQVTDPSGKLLGYLTVLSSEEAEIIAECKRRLAEPGPRYTTAQVLEHLNSLRPQ